MSSWWQSDKVPDTLAQNTKQSLTPLLEELRHVHRARRIIRIPTASFELVLLLVVAYIRESDCRIRFLSTSAVEGVTKLRFKLGS